MRTATTILALLLFAFAGISRERKPITVEYKGDRPDIVDFARAYFSAIEERGDNSSTTAKRFKAEYVNQNPRNEVIAVAYIVDPDPNGTNVRESPGGKVIKVLRSDVSWIVDLREAWNGWFRIGPEIDTGEDDAINLKTTNCWVHGSLLGASTRNYGGEVLKFHAKPDSKSTVNFTVSNVIGVKFLDATMEWAKVSYTDNNGKKLIGWIEIEWLCGNPYTTCP